MHRAIVWITTKHQHHITNKHCWVKVTRNIATLEGLPEIKLQTFQIIIYNICGKHFSWKLVHDMFMYVYTCKVLFFYVITTITTMYMYARYDSLRKDLKYMYMYNTAVRNCTMISWRYSSAIVIYNVPEVTFQLTSKFYHINHAHNWRNWGKKSYQTQLYNYIIYRNVVNKLILSYTHSCYYMYMRTNSLKKDLQYMYM